MEDEELAGDDEGRAGGGCDVIESLKLEAAAGGGLAERSKKTQKREKKIKIKSQKSIPAGLHILAETGRNFGLGGTWGCLVPVCMLVRDFPSILARTERNIQHCL